jgi:FSR family fosmidomycin resistance protein-like MFS transporter
MLPALLPSLATRFRLDASEVALLVCVFAVSSSLPQPLFGMIADRVGRPRVGALGVAVSAALMVSLSLAPSELWLWAALLVGGLGSSAFHPAGMGMARHASSGSPGLAVAIFSSVGMAGGALGPLLAVGVASTWGIEQLAWVAVPVVLVAAMLGRRRGGSPALRSHASPLKPGLGLLRGPVAWLALVALLANFVMLTFMSALPMWLVTERGLSATSSVLGVTLAVLSLAAGVGGILGGVLARRWRPDRLIVGSLALSLLALQGVLLAAPGSAPYLIAVGVAGTLMGLHSPLLIARAQELSPGSESAVSGILLGATYGVAGLLYAVLGPAQAAFGIGKTLAVVSLLVLPAAHVAAVTLRPCSPKSERQCPEPCASPMDCCGTLATAA